MDLNGKSMQITCEAIFDSIHFVPLMVETRQLEKTA